MELWRGGQEEASRELFEVVHGELRRMAARLMRRERADHTLQTTALVHEAYLALTGGAGVPWRDRAHFMAVAAQAMRHVLVAHARRHRAVRRPDPRGKRPLDEELPAGVVPMTDVLAVHALLERLQGLDPRQARVVELRYFGGMTIEETAAVLDLSVPTVTREWRAARAWLKRELRRSHP